MGVVLAQRNLHERNTSVGVLPETAKSDIPRPLLQRFMPFWRSAIDAMIAREAPVSEMGVLARLMASSGSIRLVRSRFQFKALWSLLQTKGVIIIARCSNAPWQPARKTTIVDTHYCIQRCAILTLSIHNSAITRSFTSSRDCLTGRVIYSMIQTQRTKDNP